MQLARIGALNVDDINDGEYGNAEVDLTQVLGQAGLDGVTDNIVDESSSLSLAARLLRLQRQTAPRTPPVEYTVADGVLTL